MRRHEFDELIEVKSGCGTSCQQYVEETPTRFLQDF